MNKLQLLLFSLWFITLSAQAQIGRFQPLPATVNESTPSYSRYGSEIYPTFMGRAFASNMYKADISARTSEIYIRNSNQFYLHVNDTAFFILNDGLFGTISKSNRQERTITQVHVPRVNLPISAVDPFVFADSVLLGIFPDSDQLSTVVAFNVGNTRTKWLQLPIRSSSLSYTQTSHSLLVRDARDSMVYRIDRHLAIDTLGKFDGDLIPRSFYYKGPYAEETREYIAIAGYNFTRLITVNAVYDRRSNQFIRANGIPARQEYVSHFILNDRIITSTPIGLYELNNGQWQPFLSGIDGYITDLFTVNNETYCYSQNHGCFRRRTATGWENVILTGPMGQDWNSTIVSANIVVNKSKYISYDHGRNFTEVPLIKIPNYGPAIYPSTYYDDVWFGTSTDSTGRFSITIRSTDQGVTWVPVMSPGILSTRVATNVRINNSDTLLTSYLGSNGITFAISTNKGISWSRWVFPNIPNSRSGYVQTQGDAVYLFTPSQVLRADNVYGAFSTVLTYNDDMASRLSGYRDTVAIMTTSGLYLSVDKGLNFIFKPHQLTGRCNQLTHKHGRLWSNFGNRLYLSADWGTTWQHVWTPADTLMPNLVDQQGIRRFDLVDTNLYVFGYGGAYRAPVTTPILTSQKLPALGPQALTLHPNPARDRVYINGLAADYNPTVLLINATGQVVRNFKYDSNNGIDISDLPVGIYIVKIDRYQGKLVVH